MVSPGPAACSSRAATFTASGDERASLSRASDNHVARVHTDAQCEPTTEQLGQTIVHRQAGVERPLRMILQRGGRTERSHHRVARELLDGPSMAFDLIGHGVVEAVEQEAGPLGVVLFLCHRRRSDEIGEDHRRQLPLLVLMLGHPLERLCAIQAELGVLGVLGPTVRAGVGHGSILALDGTLSFIVAASTSTAKPDACPP